MSANRKTFEEAIRMRTALKEVPVLREIFMDVAKEEGWLEDMAIEDRNIELAREMLQEGDPIDKIARLARLPLETIRELQKAILASNNS